MCNVLLSKNFSDYIQMIKEPGKFPFMDIKKIDESSYLIRNTIFSHITKLIWVSTNNIDVNSLKEISTNGKLSIDNLDFIDYVNVPADCSISKLGCAIICERVSGNIISTKSLANLTIRKADSFDIDELIKLKDESTYNDYVGLAVQLLQDNSTNYTICLLLINNVIKSFLILKDLIIDSIRVTYKDIVGIYTVNDARKLGLAKILVSSTINLYKEYDFFYVIDTEDNIASINLAKSCGFNIIGKRVENMIEYL